jgi:hypothetical protein
MYTSEPAKSGLDLVGIGKLAQAIPPEVYKQTAATVLKTFECLVAPLTQTTDGVGRLIRQTFDNWVEVRKAIGTYTLQQALIRAKAETEKRGEFLQLPAHPKTFLRALEEASLETDSVVHGMWVNLLASQLVDRNSHPRFVGVLAQLGPEEAALLVLLRPRPTNDPKLSSFIGGNIAHAGMRTRGWSLALDQPTQPWNLSATFLCQQSLADVAPIHALAVESPVLLFLTQFGQEFMAAVVEPGV